MDPTPAMETYKHDFPRIFKMFRKYAIFPATQNKDERFFSLVGRNTQSLCRNIKTETIEKKVIVASAIRSPGFVFDFNNGKDSDSDSD
jgi:hypothetical protein